MGTELKGLFTVNGHRSFKLRGKIIFFIVTFGSWYFIAKIGIRNWYFRAIPSAFN